jgi:hypothetical protein
MAHDRFEFDMPASCEVVFDAFHYHHWRARWDSLVEKTVVVGGAPAPHVGAVTENAGGGWLRGLSMKTQFVTYDRPHVAAAVMVGHSFPFTRWAASMQHRTLDENRPVMIYTYTFEAGPAALRWCIEPLVKRIFDYQTRRRFARLRDYLASDKSEIEIWQRAMTHERLGYDFR